MLSVKIEDYFLTTKYTVKIYIMNLYKLATGLSTNTSDINNEKKKSKKSSKNILNNIGSKK